MISFHKKNEKTKKRKNEIWAFRHLVIPFFIFQMILFYKKTKKRRNEKRDLGFGPFGHMGISVFVLVLILVLDPVLHLMVVLVLVIVVVLVLVPVPVPVR